MAENFTNFARTTLSAGISNSDTSIPITNGGAFPTSDFSIVIGDGATREIVHIASRSGATLTADQRGWQGTSAVSHTGGETVVHAVLAHHLNQLNNYSLMEATSKLIFSGHSLAASGGATGADRGYANIITAMLHAQDISIARGGAVLGWHESSSPLHSFKPLPYNVTGDGGWVNFLQNVTVINRGINWKGLWSSTYHYEPGDGVFTGAGDNFYVAKGATLNETPASNPTVWKEVLDGEAGQTNWAPMPGLHIMSYGLNDLGWGKDLDVFKEALRVVMSRIQAAQVWEDSLTSPTPVNHPMITYSGGWSALFAAGQYNSGETLKVLTSLAIGQTLTSYTPPDWPGGKVRFGFVQNWAQTPTGKIMLTLDGADVREVNLAVRRNYVNGTNLLNGWVEALDVAAGKHTIGFRVTEATSAAGTSFDYISLDASIPAPAVFIGLHKPLTYAAYTAPLPTDSDVDTWNAAIKTMLETEFPSVVFVEPTSLNPASNKAELYIADLLHPNDTGYRLLAKQVLDAILNTTITSDQALALGIENRSGSMSYFAKHGNTGNLTVPNDSVWRVLNVNGNVWGAVAAAPGDLLRVSVSGVWNNTAQYGYIDFCTMRPSPIGTILHYFSSGTTVQGNNGISESLANPSLFEPLCPNAQHYVVQANDIVGGQVIVATLVRVVTGSAGRQIVTATTNTLDFCIENLGPLDAIRSTYAL
jgi:hypothetical protein